MRQFAENKLKSMGVKEQPRTFKIDNFTTNIGWCHIVSYFDNRIFQFLDCLELQTQILKLSSSIVQVLKPNKERSIL